MNSIFSNIPNVTKNILILNVLFFIATLVMESKGIYLSQMLGAHYFNSPLFQPYQVVTHFFMHGSPFHLLINMLMLVMFGAHLERIWGAKRFFLFYLVAAMGSITLYNAIGMYQFIQIKNDLVQAGVNISGLNDYLVNGTEFKYNPANEFIINQYAMKSLSTVVGASGAIFGLMAAFGYLFPNTEMMLMFLPVPIKAKYFIGAYFLIEVYNSFQDRIGDNVAHIAHVGGAIAGFILVFIWNRKRNQFY